MESEQTMLSIISELKIQLLMFQKRIRDLEKLVKKNDKKNVKKNDKKNDKQIKEIDNKEEKPKKGFARPIEVTKELCDFLNKEDGTKMARTDVTKALIEYIKENNLKSVENGQLIHPDEKLKILLGLGENENVTYFTLQKYMNKHFIKNTESLVK
jgi:chromatin remodeling complex protein RSC6